jgi:hypothetical protein
VIMMAGSHSTGGLIILGEYHRADNVMSELFFHVGESPISRVGLQVPGLPLLRSLGLRRR